jgi:hypothetical protein
MKKSKLRKLAKKLNISLTEAREISKLEQKYDIDSFVPVEQLDELTVTLEPFNINMRVNTNKDSIMSRYKAYEDCPVEQVKNFVEDVESQVKLLNDEFNKQGKTYKSGVVMMMKIDNNGSSRIETFNWDDFCELCVDFVTGKSFLNNDPLATINK